MPKNETQGGKLLGLHPLDHISGAIIHLPFIHFCYLLEVLLLLLLFPRYSNIDILPIEK